MFSEDFVRHAHNHFLHRIQELPAGITEKTEELSGDLRVAAEFLYGTLPLGDVFLVSYEALLEECCLALELRDRDPWNRQLPEDLFVHFVLYPRVNNETLEPVRGFFRERLWPRVQGMNQREAVLCCNRWCCEQVSYQASDGRTEGPMTAYRSGKGRCGEESTFAVCALRSLGFPARQIYAPWWSHCDDNHAWVEVYVDGTWHFMGACEPEPVLDKGWFLAASARSMLMHTRTFSDFRGEALKGEALIEKWRDAYLYNETHRYAPVHRLTVETLLPDGTPAAGALLHLQILNMAGYRDMARLTADEKGRSSIVCGLGSLHVEAFCENLLAAADADTRKDNFVRLPLTKTQQEPEEGEFYPPPVRINPGPAVSKEAKEENRTFCMQAGGMRYKRQKAQYKEAVEACMPSERQLSWLKTACGNAGQIGAYLREGEALAGLWAEELLDTLGEKDLRDTPASALLTHLKGAMQYLPDYEGREELFKRYVLCPRVALEKLYPWRGKLGVSLTEEERRQVKASPVSMETVWKKTLFLEEWCRVWGLESREKDISAVALLRDLGVGARLNPCTGEAEYLAGETFARVFPRPAGTLLVTGEGNWQYDGNWSLAIRKEEGFMLLPHGETGTPMDLPAGEYRLMCVHRLPNGTQRFMRRYFALKEGEMHQESLTMPAADLKDMLQSVPVPQISLMEEKESVTVPIPDAGLALLLFIRPGEEPTAHILNELREEGQTLLRKAELCLVLPAGTSAKEETLLRFLKTCPQAHLYWDEEDAQALLARTLFLEPGDFPLLFLMEGDRCRFARGGYDVGTVALLERIAALLEKELAGKLRTQTEGLLPR